MPNLFEFERLFRRTLSAVGVTGSTVYMRLKPVPPKLLRLLSHVTFEDITNSVTKVRLSIQSVGVTHYLDEITDLASRELAVSRSDIILGDGDVFTAEITGSTNDDLLFLTCIGTEKDL